MTFGFLVVPLAMTDLAHTFRAASFAGLRLVLLLFRPRLASHPTRHGAGHSSWPMDIVSYPLEAGGYRLQMTSFELK